MKKIFPAVLLAAIVTNVMQAQTATVNFSKYERGNYFYKSPATGMKDSSTAIYEVNTKAVRDFLTSCKKAENPHWYNDPRGTFVYYYINGNKARRFYDKKGDFVYNILSYTEEYLPYNIRDIVKRTYYFDYKITVAEEIHTQGKAIYLVHLTNKTDLLIVRVCDDEIDVIENYKLPG